MLMLLSVAARKRREGAKKERWKRRKEGKRDQVKHCVWISRSSFLSSFSLSGGVDRTTYIWDLLGRGIIRSPREGPRFQVPRLDHHLFRVGFLFSVFYFSFPFVQLVQLGYRFSGRLSFVSSAWLSLWCKNWVRDSVLRVSPLSCSGPGHPNMHVKRNSKTQGVRSSELHFSEQIPDFKTRRA